MNSPNISMIGAKCPPDSFVLSAAAPKGEQAHEADPNAVGHPATDYILGLFDPHDWVCVVAIRGKKGDPDSGTSAVPQFESAAAVATKEYLAQLEAQNREGYSIYQCMNPLRQGAASRTKKDIAIIRNVFVDIDEDGDARLAKLRSSKIVPRPTVIVESSPQHYQVIWSVDGLDQEQAEALNKALVKEFGGDPSATDCSRVLRLPGFRNVKAARPEKPLARVVEANYGSVYKPTDFHIAVVGKTHERFVLPEQWNEGKRNSGLLACASSLRAQGYVDEEISALAFVANGIRCNPPLDDSEVTAVIKSATRPEYKQKDAERRAVQANTTGKAATTSIDWDTLDTEDTILQKQGEQIDYIVDEIIPRHRITMLFGQEKSGKSIVALDLCKHIANGKKWLNRNVAQTPCLYMDLEDGILGSYIAWVHGVGPEIIRFITLRSKGGIPALDDPAFLALCAERQPLIVLDSLHKLFTREKGRPGSSAWQSSDYEPVMEKIRQLCVAGATVILIHHSTKSDNEQYRDSSAIGANVDFLFAVVADEQSESGVKRIHLKGQPSRGAQPPTVHLLVFPHIIEHGHLCLDSGLERKDDLGQQAVAEIRKNGPAESKRALLKRLKGRDATKLAAVDAAVAKGWLIQDPSTGEINAGSGPVLVRETLRETLVGNASGNILGNGEEDVL